MSPTTSSLLGFAVKALLASTLVLAQTGPDPNKGEKFPSPGGLHVLDSGFNGGLNGLQSVSYTKNRWSWGTIPSNCQDVMVSGTQQLCNPYDIEVYDIKYSDCPNQVPHRVCRCNNAQLDIDVWAGHFGRLSAKSREWVRDVFISRSAGGGCSAWANSVDLAFFGNCADGNSVYVHETTHNLDARLIAVGGQSYSGTQDWKNKVNQGSCVADNYAKSSWAESFAQVGVMASYHANVQSIWGLGVDCMADQVGRTIELLDGALRRNGAQCGRAWGKLPVVCMGPAARDSGACPNLRQIQPEPVPELDPETQAAIAARQREALVEAGYISAKKFEA